MHLCSEPPQKAVVVDEISRGRGVFAHAAEDVDCDATCFPIARGRVVPGEWARMKKTRKVYLSVKSGGTDDNLTS
jgi:hypothetical protein